MSGSGDHPLVKNHGQGADDLCPAINVDWWEAWCFAQWVGGILPTEAQWEYACRAGTTTTYHSGDTEADLAKVGWCRENSQSTHPVGGLQANAFHLHDMHGNVWELCADWYDEAYYARSPEADPDGPESGSLRVFRGGSWNFIAWFCR